MTKLLHVLLSFSLLFAPLAQSAESVTTSALQGVQSALTGTNALLGAVQYSQGQMQGLVNQFGALQSQTMNVNTAQGQFDLVKQNLAVALAEGAQCVEKAKKDYSKLKKAVYKGSELSAITPNCLNYGKVLDSVEKNDGQIREVNKKMGCVLAMTAKIDQIAESSKTTFNNLTQAANEVYNTRQQIIDTHQGIVDKIDADLNGEKGFKAQLQGLKELTKDIGNALNAGLSGKPGEQTIGFSQRLKGIKTKRQGLANNWYKSLMGSVEYCFQSTPKTCAYGAAASPRDCIRAYVSSVTGRSAAEKASAKTNLAGLDNALILNNSQAMQTLANPGNVDVKNPESVLRMFEGRFNQNLEITLKGLNGINLTGKANKSDLTNFVQQKYRECFNTAKTAFIDDLNNGGQYQEMRDSVLSEEDGLNNEIKNMIDTAQSNMNSFRTGFTKVYNRDLAQFSSDCTASDDPYASADCLRKLYVTMKGGIEGTRQTTKLDNGNQIVYNPGPTALSLQSLSLDASGKATLTATTTSCVGFDECINVMDRYQASHQDQVQSQTKARDAFVTEHNKTVQNAMTQVASQFTAVSKMIGDARDSINTELREAAVTGAVNTTAVEGEALAADEKTGLYKTPTSMKAALAGAGTYLEFDKEKMDSVTTAVNDRIRELHEKKLEATKMKSACDIKKSDYEAIASGIGSCDEESICEDGIGEQVIASLEGLLNKGKVSPDPSDAKSTPIADAYGSCMERADSRVNKDLSTSDAVLLQGAKTPEERADLANQLRGGSADEKNAKLARANRSCARKAAAGLEAINKDNRAAGMKDANSGVINALRRMENSCPANAAAAARACEDMKKALKKAQPPTDEGPTVITETGGDSSGIPNPFSKSAQ